MIWELISNQPETEIENGNSLTSVTVFSGYVHSDPNIGESGVPVAWPKFTSYGHEFLEINSKMDRNYVGQRMRIRYVHFWASVLPNLANAISK